MNDAELIQWLRDNSSGVYRPSAEAADRMEQLLAENAKLKGFARSVRDNWDCDTGANGSHPHYCRKCTAEGLLK